jgi:dihydrofolate reductase
MKISIIAAMDSKNGIGKGNGLLFKIPEDFARMQKLTMGHPIVMGRKTFESIGRVLPGRTNVIITNNPDFQPQNCVIVHSLEEGIEKAKDAPGNDEIFIFGGGQIFKEALGKDLVDKLYLTIVEGDYDADTFFPDYSDFKIIAEEKGASGEYRYKFLTLVK